MLIVSMVEVGRGFLEIQHSSLAWIRWKQLVVSAGHLLGGVPGGEGSHRLSRCVYTWLEVVASWTCWDQSWAGGREDRPSPALSHPCWARPGQSLPRAADTCLFSLPGPYWLVCLVFSQNPANVSQLWAQPLAWGLSGLQLNLLRFIPLICVW